MTWPPSSCAATSKAALVLVEDQGDVAAGETVPGPARTPFRAQLTAQVHQVSELRPRQVGLLEQATSMQVDVTHIHGFPTAVAGVRRHRVRSGRSYSAVRLGRGPVRSQRP